MAAHRVSWMLHPIPDGLCVLHHCDHPWCVNPDHLFVGTHKDKAADMVAKGRSATGPRRAHTRVNKLTDDQVRAIRKDARQAHFVAHEHGVSETTVYNVRARRRKALVSD